MQHASTGPRKEQGRDVVWHAVEHLCEDAQGWRLVWSFHRSNCALAALGDRQQVFSFVEAAVLLAIGA